MRVEGIRRWQWCVLGAILGLLVAAVSMWSGPRENQYTQTAYPTEFEEWVLNGRFSRGGIIREIKDVKIHPPVEEFLNEYTRERELADFATFTLMVENPRNKNEVTPVYRRLLMLQRYAGHSRMGETWKMTTREYLEKFKEYALKQDKKRYPRMVMYSLGEAWMENPKYAYPAFAAIGMVVVGIIWPTIMNLLVGAGFGRAPEDPGVDLSKYKSKATAPSGPTKPQVTQDDMDKLQELESQLEASLMEGALEGAAGGTAPAAAAPAPIKKLTAGPAEPPPPEKDKPAGKPKAFGADQEDYYPTEVHGKKPS